MRFALVLAITLTASTATAQGDTSTPRDAAEGHAGAPVTPIRAPLREGGPPILGLALDAGFPDGAVVSALFRPWRPIRLEVGASYNLIGFGVRGGATFVPFPLAVAPILRVEGGHTFNGDVSGLASHFGNLSSIERTLLQNVSYDYVSVQLGLELGASDRFVFFVRGGFNWFFSSVHNFESAIQAANPGISIQAQDAKIHGVAPCATVGVLFYIW
ncbi:MAG TPA: hypothetical protein VMK12_30235 [Anaeromyxobacteraceae bacterium]|nr:hypothetical protein [Anaeromyxobacteraceae bacterium]